MPARGADAAWIKIPQRSSLLPHRGMLSFLLGSRDALVVARTLPTR